MGVLMMDPEVAGVEFRARANSKDSRALWAAAKAGRDICCLSKNERIVLLMFFYYRER